MLRKITLIPDNYKELYEDMAFSLPQKYVYCRDVCYKDDGSPVVFELGKPFIVKVGKRKFAKITIERGVPFVE